MKVSCTKKIKTPWRFFMVIQYLTLYKNCWARSASVIFPASSQLRDSFSTYNHKVLFLNSSRSCIILCDQFVMFGSGSVSHSVVSDSATPWTVAPQAPLSVEFSRKEYWSGLPFLSPEDLPDPGLNLSVLHCSQILDHLSHQGNLVMLRFPNCSNRKK